MKDTIIIIDGDFVCHTCRFTNAVYHHGEECGVIFAMLERILDLSQAYDTREIVIVWDSRHSYRKKVFPEYKLKRAKKRQEDTPENREIYFAMKRQKDVLCELLPAIGFANNLVQNGLEGDDLVAMVCRNYPERKIVIVANDHDLYQLLDKNVSIITPHGEFLGKEYRVKNFEEEFGLSPKLWHLVKAIAGCTSDEVPGVRSVGEKTACKFLSGQLKESCQAFKKITCSDGEAIKKRNLELVCLPHKKTKPIVLKKNHFDWDLFWKTCKKNRFRTFMTERKDEWESFFGK